MGMFDKFKGWLGLSEAEKTRMDRRAFLKGMAITSAGVLIPGALIFDLARRPPLDATRVFIQSDYSGCEMRINGIVMKRGSDYTVKHEGEGFQLDLSSGLLLPEDFVTISYTAGIAKTEKRARSPVKNGLV